MKQIFTALIDNDELADWCLNGIPGELIGPPPYTNVTEITITWEEPDSISPRQRWKISPKIEGDLY